MTTPHIRKKLIEVALPLEAINKASAREKSIRHGHPSTLHLWWARRPLAACRAVLFGQLVDDPSAWPDKFKGEEAQEKERQRLFRIIEQLVLWENSTNDDVLNAARWEIARSVAWGRGEQPPKKGDGKAILTYLQENAPPVYDPFCGGGSIPLEAQRLGLRAYGSDLNPVAVLISKALVEIPPKFAGLPPVNPVARKQLKGAANWSGKGAQGLAEDVRYYGKWMRAEAEKKIGHLYPQVEVTEQDVRQQPTLQRLKGQKLKVIAWLWARTVPSPNPAAKGAFVPLVSSFMLSARQGKEAWVEPVIDAGAPHGYRFEVRSDDLSKAQEEKAKAGTVARSSGGTCILTHTAMPFSYLRDEGKSGRMGCRLMAIVAEGERGRIYLPPTEEQERIASELKPDWGPEGAISHWPGRTNVVEYGMTEFCHLFTQRQLVTLTTFTDLVTEAREKVLIDASTADLHSGPRLADGGTAAEAYADAVVTYLGLGVSKLADYNSSLVVWSPTRDQAKSTFARHALPMVWDFAEINTFGEAAGDFNISIRGICRTLDELSPHGPAHIQQITAQNNSFPASAVTVSTDPPYYDNIGYADLSDFFYTWLRRPLQTVHPSLFQTLLVPKAEELVATPYRHGGKDAAEKFFLEGMKRAIAHMAAASSSVVPIAIYYAFKQSDVEDDGVASTGWGTFLQAISDANLLIDGTLPIRTERSERSISIGANALASSIILVCRKRPINAPVTTRAAFLTALKRELPAALKLLQAGNIAPVDLAQASIGPGMGIFTTHSKVLEADDRPMSVKTALQLINVALDDYLSEQEGEYDAETRFAITWFETHGMATGVYGEAETLAKARNVSVAGVAQTDLLESKGGKVRLKARTELPADWDPLTDTRLTIWECAQHLIRGLEAEGETAAASLLTKLGSRADATRDLAYRLYQICERKKWADEARAYNGLVVAWPELVKLAAKAGSDPSQEPAQGALI